MKQLGTGDKGVRISKVEKDTVSHFEKVVHDVIKGKIELDGYYGSLFESYLVEDGLIVAKVRLRDHMNSLSKGIKASLSRAIYEDISTVREALANICRYSVATIVWMDAAGKVSSDDRELKFKTIAQEMITLYSKKNKDYGNSFDVSLDEDGLLVSKIRLGDKYKRFSQLIRNEAELKDESIRDTLIDMANYSIMTIMWMDNNKPVIELNSNGLFVYGKNVAHMNGGSITSDPGFAMQNIKQPVNLSNVPDNWVGLTNGGVLND